MTIWRDAVTTLQAAWTAALDDTCTIRTNTAGKGTYNPATRLYDATPTVIYTGVCLVRPRGAAATTFGQQQVELNDYDLYLPHDTTGILPDMQVTIDTTGTTSPLLAGTTLTVTEIAADTFNARLRLGCTLNRGGGT